MQRLVVSLDIGRQAEGWGDGLLAVEPVVVYLMIVGVEQRVADRAIQQRALAIQRLVFKA
ncbi:hypothetical protein D3C79_1012780 [compost metagenome]